MTYIVKEIATATELNPSFPTGEEHIYYMGKGDAFATDIRHFTEYGFCEGWKHERFAKDYIKKEQAYNKEYGNGMWESTYEIMMI